MFMRLFNNIIIQRTNKNGTKKDIKVNCVFGQRSRILKGWENAERRAQMVLPMICINRTGYSKNNERLNNVHNEVKREITSTWRSYDLLTPIPIDISYEVSVISKYPGDIDKIASNFMVFFTNDVYVSCVHPKFEGLKLDCQVVMDDSISEEHPDEIDGSADDLITSTFNFTFKTYLFAGNVKAKQEPVKVLSAYISTYLSNGVEMSTMVSSWVDSGLSDMVYTGFAPLVNQIHIGFYPVPSILYNDITAYMNRIDELTQPGEVLEPVEDAYVDRLVWRVDPLSPRPVPDNVNVYREGQLVIPKP